MNSKSGSLRANPFIKIAGEDSNRGFGQRSCLLKSTGEPFLLLSIFRQERVTDWDNFIPANNSPV
jgi:hypothetical protein